MVNCAIIGATGYTGIELARILLRHSCAHLVKLTTRQQKAIPIRQLIPTLAEDIDLAVEPYSFTEVKRKAEVVFLCLPHTEAMQTAEKFHRAGKIVIDLSADFRIRSIKTYEKWYHVPHKAKNLLKEAVYGLPEMYRDEILKANLIANPGCYPTGVILGLMPLLKHKLVDPKRIIIDAKSGVSGAGKHLNPATQFCEVDQNFSAYKVNRHQHMPEIEQVLSDIAGSKIDVAFVPHLLPVQRGILSTIYVQKRKGIRSEVIREAYLATYGNEPFVRLKAEGMFPSLKDVVKTNFCDIGFSIDQDAGWVIVITAIDNLVKGAAGQAVQNMNIRLGFPEKEGLSGS